MNTKVIITDGLWRKSLSAARSLGKAGYEVCVIGDSFFTTAHWSRYTKIKLKMPSAKDDSKSFGSALIGYLISQNYDDKPVLLPMEDETLNWVSENRSELEDYVDFLIPPDMSLKIAQSKYLTNIHALSIDLPAPKSFHITTCDVLRDTLAGLRKSNELEKYIIKPVTGCGSAGIVYLSGVSKFDYAQYWELYGPCLIQERISLDGSGIGVSLLFDKDSKCVASFVHERLQQYPNTGGPSTSRRSIVDADLVEKSIRLLSSLGWKGIAMVEWKQDVNDECPKLLEINPRFWGSLELAVRSGVDFPLYYARACKGLDIGYSGSYKSNVICRWMIPGEVLRYITQEKSEREGLIEFLKGLPSYSEEWDRHDMSGFLATFICQAISILNPKYWKYIRR